MCEREREIERERESMINRVCVRARESMINRAIADFCVHQTHKLMQLQEHMRGYWKQEGQGRTEKWKDETRAKVGETVYNEFFEGKSGGCRR